MNVCCGNNKVMPEKLEYDNFKFVLKEGDLKFDNELGVFKYEDTKKMKEIKEEIENLETKLEEIETEKEDYKTKIDDLNLKIKNMEKLLALDMRENQYIKLIGKKTEESNMIDD